MNLTVVAGVVMFTFEVGRELYRAHKEHKEKVAEEAADSPLLFLPAQVEQFTHASGSAREFDHDVARTMHQDLAQFSVAPQDVSPAVSAIAQAYQLVALSRDLPLASDVVRQAHADGCVVLGSLSCAFLLSAMEARAILLVGREGVLEYAPLRDERGQPAAFAAIPRERPFEPEAAPVAAAAAAAAKVTRREPFPPPPAPGDAPDDAPMPPEIEFELELEPERPALLNGKAQRVPATLAALIGAPKEEPTT